MLDGTSRWAYAGSEEDDDGTIAMGWVDRDEGVIELLDQSALEAGVHLTIDCADAEQVAQALIAALPNLEAPPAAGTPMPVAQ